MDTRMIGTPIKGEDNRYHYLYLMHNNINDNYYYGVHTCDDLNDGYCGSGSKLKIALQKYGKESFTKYILEFYKDYKSLLLREKEIVNENLLQDPKCYNLIEGGGIAGSLGRCTVKDKEGNTLSVIVNHPLIGSEYQSINTGYIQTKDSNGICHRVKKDDPRIKSGELVGVAKGFAAMRDKNGNCIKVPKDDPRIKSGELISIVKNTVSVTDSIGNRYRVSKDDPRIKSGELHYHTENRITVIDKDGNTLSVYIDDPRLKSGEFVSINLNRKYVHKNGKNKMIYKNDLQKYLDDGWVLGLYKKGTIMVHKNGKRTLIKPIDLQKYLDDGWKRGQGKTKPKPGRPKKCK